MFLFGQIKDIQRKRSRFYLVILERKIDILMNYKKYLFQPMNSWVFFQSTVFSRHRRLLKRRRLVLPSLPLKRRVPTGPALKGPCSSQRPPTTGAAVESGAVPPSDGATTPTSPHYTTPPTVGGRQSSGSATQQLQINHTGTH